MGSVVAAKSSRGAGLRPIGWAHKLGSHEPPAPESGSRPELLDLIEMQLGGPVPQPGQPENWSLAPGRWRSAGRLGDDEATELLTDLSTETPVFGTNERSVSVVEVEAGNVTHSLA